MNETLINLLQQNKADKVGGRGRGKKMPSGTLVNEEMPQEEQPPGPSWQCNNLIELSRAAMKTKMMVLPVTAATYPG